MRGALLTAALVIAVLVVWPFGSGDGPSVSPALAATLNRLAQIAASGPSLVPHRGQYFYVASVGNQESDAIVNGKECVTYAPERRQVWIGADGSGLLRESCGTATFTIGGRPQPVRRNAEGRDLARPGRATYGLRRAASRSAPTTT